MNSPDSTDHPNGEDLASKLERSLADILEKSAFVFSERLQLEDFQPANDVYLRAEIQFTGPRSGSLVLAAPRSFSPQLAANMLGEEIEGITPEQAEDSVKELLNVICGEFLETLRGARAVYSLSIPVLATLTADEVSTLAQAPGSVVFNADDAPAVINVTMRS